MSSVFKRGRVYYALIYDHAARRWRKKSTRRTDRRAAELVARQWEREAADPRHAAAQAATIGYGFGLMLEDRKTRGCAEDTVDMYHAKAGHYLRIWGHDMPLSGVDAALVDAYIGKRIGEGLTRHTLHKELTTLRVMLKLMRRRGLFDKHPDDVMPVGFSSGYVPRTLALVGEQFDAMLANATDDTSAWARFIVLTGARWCEADRAVDGDLRRDVWLCVIRGTKTDKAARVAPIPPWVRRYADGLELPLPRLTNSGLRKSLHRACDLADVPRVTANDLRRTAATMMREQIGDADLVGPFLGHSGSAMVNRVYARLTGDSLRRAIEAKGVDWDTGATEESDETE